MLVITGITGKSGKYLWGEINKNDYSFIKQYPDIRLSVRQTSNLEFLNGSNIKPKLYCGDLNDLIYIDKLTKDVDILFHIAGIRCSIPLVKMAIKNGVQWIILVHTTGIYSKYKAAGEEYREIDARVYELTQQNDVRLTILRPTMIYGTINDNNMIIFIKMLSHLKFMPVVNHANYALQPVHCRDLGKAYFQVLMNREKCENNDYILSGKSPILLIDIFKIISTNLGVKNKYISIPFFIAYFGAWLIYLFSIMQVDFREKVQRLCEPRIFPHDDAIRDFGYAPMEFKKGIKEEVEEYKLKKFNSVRR